MKPLDRTLNAAILTMSRRIFPTGFDVSDGAPDTHKKLKAHLDAGRRMVVYGGGCEGTIYADPEVNHSFRAWHDWCHWRGGYDFSPEGETAVCDMQCGQLIELYGDSKETRRWADILWAEVVGQRLYYQRHKRYVDDQRGFIEAYLRDPEDALLWPLW
jgi:hypothetical protein